MSVNGSKRPREEGDSTAHPDTPKSSIFGGDTATMMSYFDNKLTKQTELLTERVTELFTMKIHETEGKILTEINKINNRVDEIAKRVTQLESTLPEVVALKDEVNYLKKIVLKQENFAVASDLRLHGIPHIEKENLHEVFNNICKTIEMEPPILKNIYRVKNRAKPNRNTLKVDPPIAIKLINHNDKNEVLKKISLFKRKVNGLLLLKHAGIESDVPIYMNELLSHSNHNILKAALAYKKKNKIHAVFTIRGLIYIKKSKDGSAICIESLEALNKFCQQENHNINDLFRNH